MRRAEFFRSFALTAEHSRQAVELAERHGWTDEPAAGLASLNVGTRAGAGRDGWRRQNPGSSVPNVPSGPKPSPQWDWRSARIRGLLELARGRDADALAAFQAADRLAGRLAEPNLMVLRTGHFWCKPWSASVRPSAPSRPWPHSATRTATAGPCASAWRCCGSRSDNPHAAIAALAPVLDGSAPLPWPGWLAQAFLLEAIARDALGDPAAAARALERALDLAEPDGALLWFLLHPAPGLLQRQARHGTAHAALIADILSLLAGRTLAPPPAGPRPPLEALSGSEIRVLRYLPTNLSMRQIAGELYVSHNTVRTHISHLYAKLGTHTRAEAVARARALGLLAPSPLRGHATRPG